MPFQYGNHANPRAHEEGTGPEILDAVPEVDVFVAGLGTGGTLTGVGRALKRARPGVRVMAAEPLPGEQVQGLRSLDEGYVPPVLDASVLDDRYLVSNRDAVVGMRRLMGEEGIFAGLSSGAACRLRCASPRDGAAAPSSCCSPTAARSTSPPACGTATSTSSSRDWSARSCGEPRRSA